VYIGSSDGAFRALDVETGAERWRFDSVAGFVECRPLLAAGAVHFGAWDGCFYALECSTGTQRWKWTGETRGILYSPAACWPVGASGKVFIVAPDRKMTAFDAESGRVIWRSANHQVRESIGLSRDGQRVYVRTMRDSIIALSTRADRPEPVWTSVPGLGYDINSSMLVEQDGVLYYPTKNGYLYALGADNGTLLWIHRLSAGAVHTPAPAGGGRIVTADFDGRITLLQHD
jgi:outer membrane protein assembly factor BamB